MPLEDWVSNDPDDRARVEKTVEIFGNAYEELFQYHPTDPNIDQCFIRLVADGNQAYFEHYGPVDDPDPLPQWNRKWLELTDPLRFELEVSDDEEFLKAVVLPSKQLGLSNWQVTDWTIRRLKVNGLAMLEENISWQDKDGRQSSSRYRWPPY